MEILLLIDPERFEDVSRGLLAELPVLRQIGFVGSLLDRYIPFKGGHHVQHPKPR